MFYSSFITTCAQHNSWYIVGVQNCSAAETGIKRHELLVVQRGYRYGLAFQT